MARKKSNVAVQQNAPALQTSNNGNGGDIVPPVVQTKRGGSGDDGKPDGRHVVLALNLAALRVNCSMDFIVITVKGAHVIELAVAEKFQQAIALADSFYWRDLRSLTPFDG